MADDKAKDKDKEAGSPVLTQSQVWTEVIGVFIIILILLKVFGGVFDTFNLNNSGLFKNGLKGLTFSGLALSNTRPLSSVSDPINARILTSSKKTIIYDSPGGKKIDERKVGDYGRVLKGPVTFDGEKYYYVDFEKGKDGWVKEVDLAYLEPSTRKLSKDDKLGSKVLASKNINVLNSNGSKIIGTQSKDSRGVITKGPIDIAGKLYYFVDFENGVDGLVEHKDLLLYNDGVRYLGDNDTVGSEVVSASADTGIYDEDGNLIDRQANGVKGKIKKGPKEINGQKYWFVEYEDGKSGWVKDEDLRVLIERDKILPEKIFSLIQKIIFVLKTIVVLAIVFFVGWIVNIIRKLTKIRENVKAKLFPVLEQKEEKVVNPKWQRVLTNINSNNSGDWKIAVLEADIMLDEMLNTMSLHGDTISDKLKSVEKSDFNTLDLAWEAHKIRNRIAHDGGDFIFTQREAKRVIGLYEQVFNEFQFI